MMGRGHARHEHRSRRPNQRAAAETVVIALSMHRRQFALEMPAVPRYLLKDSAQRTLPVIRNHQLAPDVLQ
jgi:hypothetical protein